MESVLALEKQKQSFLDHGIRKVPASTEASCAGKQALIEPRLIHHTNKSYNRNKVTLNEKTQNPTTERCRICASSLVRKLPPLDVLDCSLRRVVDVVPFLYEGCHTGRQKLRILEPCLSVCLRCRWLLLVIIVVVQACSRSLRRHGERTAVLLPKAVLQQPEITIPATHAASG